MKKAHLATNRVGKYEVAGSITMFDDETREVFGEVGYVIDFTNVQASEQAAAKFEEVFNSKKIDLK